MRLFFPCFSHFVCQLRYFRSLSLGSKAHGGGNVPTLPPLPDRRSFLSSLCAKLLPKPQEPQRDAVVDLSLETLIRFQDEHGGHQLVVSKAPQVVRKRPNYDNKGRQLLSKVVEREK